MATKIVTPEFRDCSTPGGWNWFFLSKESVWINSPHGEGGQFCGIEFEKVLVYGAITHGTLDEAIKAFFMENF